MSLPDLTHVEFEDLTFLPCRPDRSSHTGYGLAVYGADGRHRNAFDHQWCAVLPHEPARLTLTAPTIYGGMLMNHFGHFVMEAMSRLWFIHARPELPILWHWIDLPVPHTPWRGWIDEAWELLGLRTRHHHILRQPVRFGRVILPRSGLISNDTLHPTQAHALARVGGVGEPIGERVWLSRRGLPQQFGQINGEDELEAGLTVRGWQIVRPQTLPVAQQAQLFAGASIVAGFAGSAFHAAALSVAPRARLIILHRPGVSEEFYWAVAKARGLTQTFLPVALEPLGRLNAWTKFRLEMPLETARTVDEAADRGAR